MMSSQRHHSTSEGMSEDNDDGVPKAARSMSANLPVARGVSFSLGDIGGYPPVLVLFHPSMQKMATRLVQATTSRMLKLNLSSTVRTQPHPLNHNSILLGGNIKGLVYQIGVNEYWQILQLLNY